jgi:hypothetical protein
MLTHFPHLAGPSRELDQNAQHDKITLEGGIFLWQQRKILLLKKSSLSDPKLRAHVPLGEKELELAVLRELRDRVNPR